MEIQTSRLRHDLRTPVNHILGYIQLLIEETSGPPAVNYHFCFERVSGLGRDILGQIETYLPAAESAVTDQRLRDLRDALGPHLDQLKKDLDSLEFDPSSSQFADVRLMLRARDRLANFVATGSLDGPSPASAPVVQEKAQEPGHHFLVVDDDAPNREMLARILTRLKYRVSMACSGEEAITLTAQSRYDLVLLDLMMPGMDGYKVLERLKTSAPEVPVIVISALEDMESIVRCITMGAEDYFVKPFEAGLLRARILSALGRQEYRRQIGSEQQFSDGNQAARIASEIKDPLNSIIECSATALKTAARIRAMRPVQPDAGPLLAGLEKDLQTINEAAERAAEIAGRTLHQPVKV